MEQIPMSTPRHPWLFLVPVVVVIASTWPAVGDDADDVADIPSQDLHAGNDTNQRYFLIGPRKDAPKPKRGYGLLVILPGGDGSADFHPFVKRIFKHGLPQGYLAAQPVAVKWTEDQEIVWPTEKNRVEGVKFTTEEFVEAVICDVRKKHSLDSQRIFTLAWSSSGPAAYALSLREKKSVCGSFIAMSVFQPDNLPDLKAAKGHAYYLYHSEEDQVCPFQMAQDAKEQLAAADAKVTLQTYEGGHGWHGNLYADLRTGIEWLEKNAPKSADKK
jgi:predicted esterase